MDLLTKLQRDYPDLVFRQSKVASWSPHKQQISYAGSALQEPGGAWSMLHELGHAILGHTLYKNDVELLKMEVDAWHEAEALARRYDIAIDSEHIQDCLDTYRDWLHKRSTCPHCHGQGVQGTQRSYRCLNCGGTWNVSSERFCRPYRLTKTPQA